MKLDWTFVVSFAAGAVAGAVTALLYAPTDGATLRTGISDKVTSGVDSVSRQVETITETYGSKYETARFQVERLFAAVTAGVEEGRRVKDEIQQAFSEETN